MKKTNQLPTWRLRLNQLFAVVLLTTVLAGVSACSVNEQTGQGSDELLNNPVIDQKLSEQDFGFPSQPPQLSKGKTVFEANCSTCHTAAFFQQGNVKRDLAYTTPIDLFVMLSSGKAPKVVNPVDAEHRPQVLPAEHPAFKDLSRDERWEALFYARYLAGAGDIKAPNPNAPEVANIYGGNCAVCHGTRGFADGPLHLGKTGSHEIHDAVIKHNLQPAPANFHQYNRLYNRTDAQLVKYVCEGNYPSAKPSWYGNVHRDASTGKVEFVFDDSLIWNLIRHVRTFAYEDDLNEANKPVSGIFATCEDHPTNQSWTELMEKKRPRPVSMKTSSPTKGHKTHQVMGVDMT